MANRVNRGGIKKGILTPTKQEYIKNKSKAINYARRSHLKHKTCLELKGVGEFYELVWNLHLSKKKDECEHNKDNFTYHRNAIRYTVI